MTTQTAFDTYTMPEPPTSPGRAFLARAFAHWCALEHGFSAEEIGAALDGDPGVSPCVRDQVAESARLLGEVFAAGHVRTWSRPRGGGVPREVDPGLWELDDFRGRHATSGVSLARPFDRDAAVDHWLFVELEDFNALLEARFPDMRTGGGAPRSGRKRAEAPPPKAAVPDGNPVVGSSPARQDRLVRLPELKTLVGMSRSTIYQRIGEKRFPAQVVQGGIAAWRLSEVEEWLANPT